MDGRNVNEGRGGRSYQGVGVPHYPKYQHVFSSKNNMKETPQDNRGPPRRSTATLDPVPNPQLLSISTPAHTMRPSSAPEDLLTPAGKRKRPTKNKNRDQSKAVHMKKTKLLTHGKQPQLSDCQYVTGESSSAATEISNSFQDPSSFIDQNQQPAISAHDLQNDMEAIQKQYKADKVDTLSQDMLTKDNWRTLKVLHHLLFREGYDFLGARSPLFPSIVLNSVSMTSLAKLAHTLAETLRNLIFCNHEQLDNTMALIYLAEAAVRVLMQISPQSYMHWAGDMVDLRRYRCAIEDSDARDRELWANFEQHFRCDKADHSETIVARIFNLLQDIDLVDKIEYDFTNATQNSTTRSEQISAVSYGALWRKDSQNRLLLTRFVKYGLFTYDNTAGGLSSYLADIASESVHGITHQIIFSSESYVKDDTGVDTRYLLENLSDYEAFLFASQHPEAPCTLKNLARKYEMPKHVWRDNLAVLLDRVKREGTAQDMLCWLQYGYDYICNLRKVAPDLESDWVACQKGLDLYREELEQCRSFNRSDANVSFWSTSASIREDKTLRTPFSALDFGSSNRHALPEHDSIDGWMNGNSHIGDSFEFDDFLDNTCFQNMTEDDVMNYSDSLFNITSDHDASSGTGTQVITPLHVPPLLGTPSSKSSIDSLQVAADRLSTLSPSDLQQLRCLVLEGWELIGQDMRFHIYAKVHDILSRCGLELAVT